MQRKENGWKKALNEVNEGIRKRNRWIEEKVIDRELEHGIMSVNVAGICRGICAFLMLVT